MDTLEVIILAAGTVVLIILTWELSIKAKRYHGFYRFVAFESIFILALLNWHFWFVNPFAWHQVLSWMLLVGSIPLAVEGFRLLHVVGRPDGQFENTTKLVTVGVYKYIRHPLYASLIIVGLGIFFKQITWITALLAVVNTAALFATAKTEEKEMIGTFGAEYSDYMKRTNMFFPWSRIPFVIGWDH